MAHPFIALLIILFLFFSFDSDLIETWVRLIGLIFIFYWIGRFVLWLF